MDSNLNRDDLHKIVILNPKGGCGKTTLATNLASHFALRGPPPTLVDCDPGGYSMRWLEKRPAARPKIFGVTAYDYSPHSGDSLQTRVWPESREMIVDLPAAVSPNRLFELTYDATSVLIPVNPSEIDVYSAAKFIADLLLVAQFDRRNRNLAIVANRTRRNTNSYRALLRFLTSLEIPAVAELRDSQNFVYAAANGIGVSEMPAYKAQKDCDQIQSMVTWLDKWRMRRLDSFATARFQHAPGAELLTPTPTRTQD